MMSMDVLFEINSKQIAYLATTTESAKAAPAAPQGHTRNDRRAAAHDVQGGGCVRTRGSESSRGSTGGGSCTSTAVGPLSIWKLVYSVTHESIIEHAIDNVPRPCTCFCRYPRRAGARQRLHAPLPPTGGSRQKRLAPDETA